MKYNDQSNNTLKALSFGEGWERSWRSEGQCTCGGTLTVKYEYIADRSIKLRIKPNKKRFNLYGRRWGEWDKPLDELQTLLESHGLA